MSAFVVLVVPAVSAVVTAFITVAAVAAVPMPVVSAAVMRVARFDSRGVVPTETYMM